MRWRAWPWALPVLWAVFAACAQPVTVRDDAGREVRLDAPARRIVTLAPSHAEFVHAVGTGDALLAVSRHSDYPQAVTRLPVVGDAFAINLEAISHLKPDLVTVWLSGTPQRQREALKALGARQGFAVYESEVRDVASIASTLMRLGELTGHATQAREQAARVNAQWAALEKRYRDAKKVRVFYQVWEQPLMTFNGEHLVTRAMHACGASTGFDKLPSLTPTVSREAVIAWNPQLILNGDGLKPESGLPRALQIWTPFRQIDAVHKGLLRGADGALLTRMGPRFVTAAEGLCTLIDQAR